MIPSIGLGKKLERLLRILSVIIYMKLTVITIYLNIIILIIS